MAWKINYEGETYREVELTLAQAEQVEQLVGTTWLRISPMSSARHAKALLACSRTLLERAAQLFDDGEPCAAGVCISGVIGCFGSVRS